MRSDPRSGPGHPPPDDPADMPRTAAGTVHSALIRSGQAVFEVTVHDAAVTALAAQRVLADGSSDVTLLDGPAMGMRQRCGLPLAPGAPPLRVVRLLGRIGGAWHRLETAPGGGSLERLLSTTLEEVNANLRWGKRIPDLETRFFAARNSVGMVGRDIVLRARCSVSVGYGGIEIGNEDILAWCLEEQAWLWPRLAETEDMEIRASLLVFWCHLAVQRQDAAMLAEISAAARAGLMRADVPAISVYNLLCLGLLLGAWHLAHGEVDAAADLLGPSDRLFRLAVRKYPRALVNYREIITIAECNFHCQIGRAMAEGRAIPAHLNIPRLTPALAWNQGNRLRDAKARARLEQTYKALC